MPIYTCPGAGPCVAFCYSLKAWQYPAALARQLQNTLLVKFAPEVIEAAFMALPQGTTFRLYVDGDFDSSTTVDFWFRVIAQRPDVNVYGYSKSWDLLNGRTFPANYWLNLSSGGKHQTATAAELAPTRKPAVNFSRLRLTIMATVDLPDIPIRPTIGPLSTRRKHKGLSGLFPALVRAAIARNWAPRAVSWNSSDHNVNGVH